MKGQAERPSPTRLPPTRPSLTRPQDPLRTPAKKENSPNPIEPMKNGGDQERRSKDEQTRNKRRTNSGGSFAMVLAGLGILFVCGWCLTHLLNSPIRVQTWTEPGPDGVTPSKDSDVFIFLVCTVVVSFLQLALFIGLFVGLVYRSKPIVCCWAILSPILFIGVAAIDIVTVYKYRTILFFADEFVAWLILGLYLAAITLGYLITLGACIMLTRSKGSPDKVQTVTR